MSAFEPGSSARNQPISMAPAFEDNVKACFKIDSTFHE